MTFYKQHVHLMIAAYLIQCLDLIGIQIITNGNKYKKLFLQ